MPVVKANAYGHGLTEVSLFLEQKGFGYFGVAYPEEGKRLRMAGITSAIHVFTLTHPTQAELVVRHRLEPTIAMAESLTALRSAAERARRTIDVHLKIETGMNRIGVREPELRDVLRSLGRSRRLRLKGVFTHLATSDQPGSVFVARQLDRFEAALEILRAEHAEPEVIHAANSGAILRHPRAHYSMVRPGIMMYGYSPVGAHDRRADLRPAMRIVSALAQVKRIGAGESVSYGRTFRARRSMVVGTVPIGYADGIFRSLSGKGQVLLHGTKRPMIGRVCMDQLMVDCGRLPVRPGSEVVLLGRQGARMISAWEVAGLLGTIPYELTCAVSDRVPREYVT